MGRLEQPQKHRLAEIGVGKVVEKETVPEGGEMTRQVTEKLLPPSTTCDLNGNSLFLTLKKKRVSMLCVSRSHATCS